MGTHIQRKRFDSILLAKEQAAAFYDPDYDIPGLRVDAIATEDADGAWVVLTQSGDIVTGDEPCLPDYERVL